MASFDLPADFLALFRAVQDQLGKLATRVSGLGGQLGGNAIVRGVINTTGPSIVEGSGYSIVKNGTGDVTVTFNPPFSDVPAFTCTPQSASGRLAQMVAPATASTARVAVLSTAFAAAESEVHFIAVGPV